MRSEQGECVRDRLPENLLNDDPGLSFGQSVLRFEHEVEVVALAVLEDRAETKRRPKQR